MTGSARTNPIVRCLSRATVIGVLVTTAVAAAASGATATARAVPVGGAARAARRDTSNQTIDAAADPDGAARALAAGCADMTKCTWSTNTITGAYGPPRILGDILYNCSTDPADIAETSVGVSDDLSQTTSLSEKISLKLSLGLIGIASTSLEVDAFTKQAISFDTEVTVTNAVPVPPGWRGYTTTQVLSANVVGTTTINTGDGNTITVTNIDMSFPGYVTQAEQGLGLGEISTNGIKQPMTAGEIDSHCKAVNDNPSGALGAPAPSKGRKPPTGSFKLLVCKAQGSCATRKVTGAPPPATDHAAATLTARGLTYAAGQDIAGRLQLAARRTIRSGRYTLKLTLSEHHGRTVTNSTTIIPITIR